MRITAATNQHKVPKHIQRALQKDPNDIRSLLQLAATLGSLKPSDRDHKRTLLRRILSLDPANHEARQMLLELDRAAIGGNPARLSAAVILTTPSSAELSEPPLTLRYSIVHQFLVYFSMALTAFAGLNLTDNPEVFALIGGFFLSLLVPLWYVSGVVEIENAGLHISHLFGIIHTEIPWSEVRECRPHAFGIKLINRHWDVVDVSSQVYGYTFILDILRQMRPDLFETAEVTGTGDTAQTHQPSTSLGVHP
jgi:hypothetical protein